MRDIRHDQLMEAYCKQHGCYMMYVSFDPKAKAVELLKAAPYLADPELFTIRFNGHGWIVCDDEAEMRRLYNQTVGEDGPTESNPYDGSVLVYALTCGPDGLLTENT